ncbi:hypothetical protein QOZ80_4AG0316700 [Eleusine coracana subsp. coracana]|nr:hypothetical protein QOZ80_4AG0316700 [Eleusine coracana subsp. coracana]
MKQQHEFERFADRLTQHDPSSAPPLETFRLRVSCVDLRRTARRWIWRGLERRPAAFHLCCDKDDPLGLCSHWDPCFPDLIVYPHPGPYTCRLRTLHHSGLSLSSAFVSEITAESPVLEDMHLEHCTYESGPLASHSLRKLFIDRCPKLVLAVPRLTSLRINGGSQPLVNAEAEMPSLVSASLLACSSEGDLDTLCSLRDARGLDLSGFSATSLLVGESQEGVPMFRNLKALLLSECELGVDCQVLRRFLRDAPCLETLTLHDCTFAGGARTKKRKRMSSQNDGHDPAIAYPCKNLSTLPSLTLAETETWFDDDDADFDADSEEEVNRQMKEWHKFQDAADRLTLPNEASSSSWLERFRLRVSCVHFREAHRWIRRGLERRPVAFHLCCDNDDPDPRYGDMCPDFPDRILQYPNDASANTRRLRAVSDRPLRVTAASPVLEEIHLQSCNYMWMRLASGSLKKLFIDPYCDGFGCGGPLVLALPRIAPLHINGRAPLIIFEGEMPSLVSASVTCSACDDLGIVLCALRDVRSLDLTGFSAPDLLLVDHEPGKAMPVFRNLRTLLLDACELGAECQALCRFLSNAPGLETLTLRNCIFLGASGSPGRQTTSSDNGRAPTTTAYYPSCNNLSSIELEFEDISELVYAVNDISKQEVVDSIEISFRNGIHRAKIRYR